MVSYLTMKPNVPNKSDLKNGGWTSAVHNIPGLLATTAAGDEVMTSLSQVNCELQLQIFSVETQT